MKFLRFSGWPAAGAVTLGALALGIGGGPAALAARAMPADGAPIPVGCSAGDLASAISGAPDDATLILEPSCTYTLTAALPPITQTLTILGSNDRINRPFWADPFSLFCVTGDGELTLSHLTLTGGENSEGGAIDSFGDEVTVISSFLAENTATGSDGGGAIYNHSGSVSVLDSTLSDNQAEDGPGGAISSNGFLAALHDSFTGNEADGDGGAIYSDQYTLGPIRPATAGHIAGLTGTPDITLYLNGGNVIGNESGYNGGGIAVFGGAEIKNALVNSNHAEHQGGGIYNGSPGTADVDDTQVAYNSAEDGGGGIYNAGDHVYLFGTTKVNYNEPDNCEPDGTILGCFG